MPTLLRFIIFLVLPWSFWAQGDDCGTATPINNVQNYCSGNAVFNNVGSTPGTYGLPTCWPANATDGNPSLPADSIPMITTSVFLTDGEN